MFNSSNGYSLADIAAATGNGRSGENGGFGENGAWWIIILFLFCFAGWGGNGWGNGAGNGGANSPAAQGMVTRADLCSEFQFNNLDRAVTGINQGICDGFYAMNTGLLNATNGLNSAICNLGYEQAQLTNGTNVALMQGQNAIATQLADCCCKTQSGLKDVQFANQVGQNAIQTQLASCCCDLTNQVATGFGNVKYDMATNTNALQVSMANNTRDIIDSQNAGTRAILDYLCQEKISDLQSENQSLRLAASQQAQNNYIVSQLAPKAPVPAWIVANPATPYNPCNGNYSYGCGNCA